MLRHVASGLQGAIVGYLLGVAGCWLLLSQLSSNQHDASLEALMTAFFAGGPAMAILGFAAGIFRSLRVRSRRRTGASDPAVTPAGSSSSEPPPSGG